MLWPPVVTSRLFYLLDGVNAGTSHGGGYNQESVVYALKDCGYRLIDTARRYGVEHLIGQAIKVLVSLSSLVGFYGYAA